MPECPLSICSAQDGLHSKSSTIWWTWGAYDLTCSMCWMFVIHGAPVMSFKRQAIWFAVSAAQACHTSLSTFFPETLSVVSSTAETAAVFGNGEVTFWWMCKMPPVVLFSSRQATGQPSSELGMRPRFTRSAMSHSWSWKKMQIKNSSILVTKLLFCYSCNSAELRVL